MSSNTITLRKYFLWNSQWFCDYSYYSLLFEDIKINNYLQSIFLFIKFPTSNFIIKRYFNKIIINSNLHIMFIFNKYFNFSKLFFYIKKHKKFLINHFIFKKSVYFFFQKISFFIYYFIFKNDNILYLKNLFKIKLKYNSFNYIDFNTYIDDLNKNNNFYKNLIYQNYYFTKKNNDFDKLNFFHKYKKLLNINKKNFNFNLFNNIINNQSLLKIRNINLRNFFSNFISINLYKKKRYHLIRIRRIRYLESIKLFNKLLIDIKKLSYFFRFINTSKSKKSNNLFFLLKKIILLLNKKIGFDMKFHIRKTFIRKNIAFYNNQKLNTSSNDVNINLYKKSNFLYKTVNKQVMTINKVLNGLNKLNIIYNKTSSNIRFKKELSSNISFFFIFFYINFYKKKLSTDFFYKKKKNNIKPFKKIKKKQIKKNKKKNIKQIKNKKKIYIKRIKNKKKIYIKRIKNKKKRYIKQIKKKKTKKFKSKIKNKKYFHKIKRQLHSLKKNPWISDKEIQGFFMYRNRVSVYTMTFPIKRMFQKLYNQSYPLVQALLPKIFVWLSGIRLGKIVRLASSRSLVYLR